MNAPVTGPVPVGPKGPVKTPETVEQMKSSIEAATEAAKDAALVFDTEAQALTANQARPNKQADFSRTTNADVKTKEGKLPPNTVEQAIASEMTDELKKKQKKKLTAWEEKMEELAKLEGLVDEQQVDEEEKGIIREFFDNLSRIRQMRQRLKQLEKQRKYYEDLLEQERRQKKQQPLPGKDENKK